MDIFLAKINEEIQNKIALSKLQHNLGRKILSYILEKSYNIKPEIFEENQKPYVKNNPIYFSISHSKYLVGVAFDNNPIGLDIEFKRKRDYKKILKYLNFDKEASEEEFFQLWTVYEAEYKSGIKENVLSFNYGNYTISTSYATDSNKLNLYLLTQQQEDFSIKTLEKPTLLKNLSDKLRG